MDTKELFKIFVHFSSRKGGIGDNPGETKMCLLLLLRHVSRVWLCATPQTAAHQAPPSLGFSRQEHWSVR